MAEGRPGNDASPREVWEHAMRQVKGGEGYNHDRFAELFASDGVMELPFAPPGVPRRLQGPAEIRTVLEQGGKAAEAAGYRTKGFGSLAVHETKDPEVIVVEYSVVGEVVPAGDPYELFYIQVVRVRDGEILLLRDYWAPQMPGIDLALKAMGAATGD